MQRRLDFSHGITEGDINVEKKTDGRSRVDCITKKTTFAHQVLFFLGLIVRPIIKLLDHPTRREGLVYKLVFTQSNS